ncbi:MAG: sulfotransferase [Bacteroidetes bacterium]|nr:sulfotransferase [Bacteroidota bacterium]
MINIKISANETYWINSEKISVEPDEQYKISSKIVGKKGIFRSCYFTVFLLDKEEKEIIRKWRWITDFSENEINYDIIFTTVPKTKYLISGYRVNLETDRKADVELEVQELTKLKFEKIANRVNDLYDNRPDYRYPTPASIDQSKLFIIIGHGRSGTQILLQVMKTFDGCSGNAFESRDYETGGLSLYRFVIKQNDFSYLEKFILEHWADEFFVEKTTNSIFCLPQIHKRFPNANYIFLERNPFKILLSFLNYLPPAEEGVKFRKKFLLQGHFEKEEDLSLNPEIFYSKLILREIKLQKTYKSLFKNQITIRYEDFVENFEHNLRRIEKKFGLKPNIELAKEVFSKPSTSSINNTYFIKSISNLEAIKNITEACRLWDYDKKDDLEDFIKPKTKYDLINWFAKEYNFSSYLEISTLTTGHYFDKVDSNFFKIKDCINYYVEEHEPLYSKFGNTVLKDHDFKILPFDDYLNKIIDKNQKYDVIFVDPFHTVEHTIRDLEAALSLLSSTGIIIVHDCFPDSEALIGPWKGRGAWCGQTYEGYIRFLLKNSHFENFVINIDYGCGIIRPHYKSTIKRDFAVDADKLSSWEYYWDHHNQLLNLESIDKFYDLYTT